VEKLPYFEEEWDIAEVDYSAAGRLRRMTLQR
jgi:hypothetical protein